MISGSGSVRAVVVPTAMARYSHELVLAQVEHAITLEVTDPDARAKYLHVAVKAAELVGPRLQEYFAATYKAGVIRGENNSNN